MQAGTSPVLSRENTKIGYLQVDRMYDILSAANVVFHAQNVPKSLAAGAPPRTPLGELTTLPQTPSLVLQLASNNTEVV